MGGLGGGLYKLFGFVGFLFFSALIGRTAASHHSLEKSRVRAGAFVILTTASLPVFLKLRSSVLSDQSDGALPILVAVLLSLISGVLVGSLILANVLISYLDSIAWTEEEAKRRAALIAKGIDPDKTCFVATAVYLSADAPEVVVLRRWRDRHLLLSAWGRLATRLYYLISPVLVVLLEKSKFLRRVIKFGLDRIVKLVEMSGRTGA